MVQLYFVGGIMTNKKMTPCRVCGKMFEPCSYCQSNADVFRWRNFACSLECAKKYIDEATAYRQEQRKKIENIISENKVISSDNIQIKKKSVKKKIVDIDDSVNKEVKDENIETE